MLNNLNIKQLHKLCWILQQFSILGLISLVFLPGLVLANKPLKNKQFSTISNQSIPLQLNELNLSKYKNIVPEKISNSEADRLVEEGNKLFEKGDTKSLQEALKKLERANQLYQVIGNKGTQAAILVYMGVVYSKLGDKEKALEYLNQALPLSGYIGDKIKEDLTLRIIGDVYSDLGENKKALEYYNQALAISRTNGNRIGEAVILNNIGNIYNLFGEKEKALKYYTQSSSIVRAIEDRELEAIILNNIGDIYSNLGENKKALEYFNQSLSISRTIDKVDEATTLNNIGNIYNVLGENQKALEYYNQGLSLSQKIGDRANESRTLNGIGFVYKNRGEKEKALEYYNQSLSISKNIKDREGEAITLINIGALYDSLGENKKALEYYNQALSISQAIGDKESEATTLNNIGSVYSELGENKKALEYYNQTLSISQAIGNRLHEGMILNNIGLLYSKLGENEKTLKYYNQSLSILQAIGNRVAEGNTLHNIGSLYFELGENEKALKYYNQSLPIRQAVEDKSGEGFTLNNIGLLYSELGEDVKALEYLKQALSISQKIGDRRLEAVVLNNIGSLFYDLEEKEKVLEYYDQSLSISQATGNKEGEANTLNNIGSLYYNLEENEKALEYFNLSLLISQAIGDRGGAAITLFYFAHIQTEQGNLIEALINIEKAIKIIEDLRTKIGSQELRQSYFATVQDYYEFYINLLMKLHEKNPSAGYDVKALHVSERAKARGLLELLKEGAINIHQGVDSNLLNQEKLLIFKLNQAENLRLQYVSNSLQQPEKIEEIKKTIDQILTELEQLKLQIKKTSPRYAQLTQPEPLTVKEIQDQLLDDQTVLLEYFVGENNSYLWVVSKNNLTTYTIPGKKELKVAVDELRTVLTHPRYQNKETLIDEQADKLTNMILTPASKEIKGKHLLVVADGPLQYIPFAVLSLPDTVAEGQGYQPIISQQTVINLPSASTLAIIRENTANRPLAPRILAVIADPVFSPDDERLAKVNSQVNDTTIQLPDITRGTDSAGLTWQRLVFTRQEAEAIIALLPQDESKKVLDFQADYENVMQGDLSQYQIIHFATHGFINTEKPELSAIILSLLDKQGNWENGYLRLSDIFNLNLPAELVVLSACETGLGKEIKGEGLVGLTRGFMYAGAKKVLVSLWNVDDQKTAELMTVFYEKMLKEKLSPAESLRIAQVTMWKKGYSPYYWGAFTAQGDWQ